MSRLGEDIKAGVKGIRGAGDVLRGEVMGATDKIFENKHDARDAHAQAKDRAVTEKGKADLRGMDEMFARREWERKGVPPPTTASTAPHEGYTHSGAPSYEQPIEQPIPQHGTTRPMHTEAGAPPLPDRPVPDETLRYETRRPPPTELPGEPGMGMALSGAPGHHIHGQGVSGTHVPVEHMPGQHVPGESVATHAGHSGPGLGQNVPAQNAPGYPSQGLGQTVPGQYQHPPGQQLGGESIPGRDFPDQPRYA